VSGARPLYLDYAATTPVDPRVAARMADVLTAEGEFGNAASLHAYGRRARVLVEQARAQVARLLGCAPPQVIFTSGATEAANLALLGYVRGCRARAGGGEVHVICGRTEHKAVLDPCRQLEREGCALTWLTPGADGVVMPEQLAAALRPTTVLVALMHANNETGHIQDVASFGALCRAQGAALFVDASQSAGKLAIDVEATGIDLLAFTAHKIHGPKGSGALYVRDNRRGLIAPLQHGGGHERGLRPGTLATHQVVGLGAACELAQASRAATQAHCAALRARLWSGLADLPGAVQNGSAPQCLPGILNVSFPGVEGESLVHGLVELALSTGSACNSDSDEPSYVLRALGRDRETAQASLRLSLGATTTEADIDLAIAAVRREVLRLRVLAEEGAMAGVGAVASQASPAPGPAGAVTDAVADPLPPAIRTRFTAPQHAGALAGHFEVVHVGEAGDPAQGTWIRLQLGLRVGLVAEARFAAYGCPWTIAACDWLAGRLVGTPAPGAGASATLGGPLDWARELGVPEARLARLLVLEDALRAAWQSPLGTTG
jgi:cysteine desulfurase